MNIYYTLEDYPFRKENDRNQTSIIMFQPFIFQGCNSPSFSIRLKLLDVGWALMKPPTLLILVARYVWEVVLRQANCTGCLEVGLIFQLDSFFVEGRKNPGGVKPQSVKTALTVRIKYMLMLYFLILRPRFLIFYAPPSTFEPST